jgi:DnaJ-class molecular chaperone
MPVQAYAVLSDSQQRQAYNARLQEQLQDDLDDFTGKHRFPACAGSNDGVLPFPCSVTRSHSQTC